MSKATAVTNTPIYTVGRRHADPASEWEGGGGAEPSPDAAPRLASDVVTCASAASMGKSCPIAGAVEVGTGNGAASEARRSYRAGPGMGSFNKAVAAAAAALDVQIIPMPGAIRVTFHQPLPPDLTRAIKGTLVAQVHARGKLHHYRIRGADGTMYFVPRRWLGAMSRVLITHADRLAGRPLPDVGEQLDDLIAMMDEESAIGTRASIGQNLAGTPVLCLERVA